MNYSDYVRISSSASNDDLTFSNDSQADICVIKASSIKNNIEIDNTNIIKIRGITDEVVESFGTIALDLFFNNIIIEHTFHVVPDDFCIPSDGIIGKDFNRRFKCLIDYSDMTFTIRCGETNVKVKIFSEPKHNISALLARCEIYRIVHVPNFVNKCLIPAQEITPGVHICTYQTLLHTANMLLSECLIRTQKCKKFVHKSEMQYQYQ